jgi:hypothetical protein
MPGHPREMITMAERRFPVRIRIGVPPGGFGQRYAEVTVWLDENCGADRWAMTPSGLRGALNDALSIYFLDATLASAFVFSGNKVGKNMECESNNTVTHVALNMVSGQAQGQCAAFPQ